jgi:hypothetical protein
LISPAPTNTAQLVPINESDIHNLAGFIAVQSGRDRDAVEDHLGWFLLQNPVRQPQYPLGFALHSSGEPVGCILCLPQMFCCHGKQILMMGSSSFYVNQDHRGQGGRIFLQYSRLGRQWPLLGTSTNAESAALWKAAGANPIAHSEGELLGILHWPPFVEEFVHRSSSRRLVSRVAGGATFKILNVCRRLKGRPASADLLHPLSNAEQVIDAIAGPRSEKLTALRDLSYIRWRYFSARETTIAAFCYRSQLIGRTIFVAVNQRPRGYRGQIKTLNVLDVYPEVSAAEWVSIVAALVARYSSSVHGIVLRHQNSEMREAFQELGFRWRSFDAPTGWLLDRAQLLPDGERYIVPADGDGLI